MKKNLDQKKNRSDSSIAPVYIIHAPGAFIIRKTFISQ